MNLPAYMDLAKVNINAPRFKTKHKDIKIDEMQRKKKCYNLQTIYLKLLSALYLKIKHIRV